MCIVQAPSDPPGEPEPLAGAEIAGGSKAAPPELLSAVTEGAAGALTALDVPALDVPAVDVPDPEMHNSSPGRAESSSCDRCAALIWRHPALDTAFVTPGAVAGPDTGIDEPAEELDPDEPLEPGPEEWLLAGACSVGGGASVVNPPEDLADDPDLCSSELTGGLVDPKLDELEDVAGSELVAPVALVSPVGLVETPVAGGWVLNAVGDWPPIAVAAAPGAPGVSLGPYVPWVPPPGGAAATADELVSEDESEDESEAELPEPLGKESELSEPLSESFCDPPLPFLLGASAVCWDSGVVWPNCTAWAVPW